MKIGILARRLLEAVGEPMPSHGSVPVLCRFDWHEHGVQYPYVIFMTGRCGSTWLTALLRNTGLVGNPGEFFNGDVAKRECKLPAGLSQYLSSVVESESSCGRFGIEIDSARLKQIDAFIDWSSVFPRATMATFFLYRRDIVAQAWSWVAARKSGLWHLRGNAEQPVDSRRDVLPTEEELIKEIIRIRGDEEFLGRFFLREGYTPYFLDYESLVSEMHTEVVKILKILGVPDASIDVSRISDNGAISKINHSEKHLLLAEFSIKYRDALSQLSRDRFGIDSNELSALLAA